MRKTLLISALLASSLLMAQEYNYEITPVIGTNIPEGNLDLDNQFLTGAELQYNGLGTLLSPELSLLYTNNADYKNSTFDTPLLGKSTRILSNVISKVSRLVLECPINSIIAI